jgi:hypothetical protein
MLKFNYSFFVSLLICNFIMAQSNTSRFDCDEDGKQSSIQGSPSDSLNSADDGIALSFQIVVPISRDPNEIWGPTGYGDERFVAKANPLGYTILFENDPEFATAPAQLVRITYPIHFNQNLSSFHLGDFSLNNNTFTIPYNSTSYSSRLDMRDSIGVYVDVIAGIDIINQRAFWIFEAIDPVTGLRPLDPLKGVLPVADSLSPGNLRGHGFVNFTISPKNSTVTGDTMLAQASIIFDINDPVITNTEKHTIDALAPTSNLIVQSFFNDTLTLKFIASDDPGGSGVAYYDLYLAQDSLNYITYLVNYKDSVVRLTGLPGKQYSFFSIATDNVGNRESMKNGADGSFLIPLDTNYAPIVFYNGDSLKRLNQVICAGSTINTCFTVLEADSDLVFYNFPEFPKHGNVNYSFTPNGVCVNYLPDQTYGGLDSVLFTACDLVSGCDSVWVIYQVDSLFNWYSDIDLDGYGVTSSVIQSCYKPNGYVRDSADCNDNEYMINPGVPELCDTIDNNCNLIVDESCLAGVNIKLFIEGFYNGPGTMAAVLDPVNKPHLCDSVVISLASPNAPYLTQFTDARVIRTNGLATFYFPSSIVGQSFYIVAKHRNSIETWSKTPVTFTTPVVTFDFSQ